MSTSLLIAILGSWLFANGLFLGWLALRRLKLRAQHEQRERDAGAEWTGAGGGEFVDHWSMGK